MLPQEISLNLQDDISCLSHCQDISIENFGSTIATVRYIFGVAKMIKLSEYVRDVVNKKGLSSGDVQKRSRNKISFGYVNDIINERTTNPSVEKLQALALGLGVPEDELFRVARGLPIEEVKNPVESDLLEKFNRLPRERQQEILKLLDFYDSLDLDTERPTRTPTAKIQSSTPTRKRDKIDDWLDTARAKGGVPIPEKDRQAIRAILEKREAEKSK